MINKIIVLMLLVLSVSCYAQENEKVNDSGYALILNTLLSHTVPEISVAELKKNKDNFILLDAREEEEYAVSHIKEAKYIGYDYFSADSINQFPKDKPIVVYCSVGYRSEKITEKLEEMGYQEVYNLYGGIFEWVNEGNEVVTGEKAVPTEQVHAYDRVWGTWLKQGEKVY
jgi:rhodanese-related sulfurtransferase